MSVKTETRKTADGKTEYWCGICSAWVKGEKWDGTGYTEIVCPGCGKTFDDDYYGTWAAEKKAGSQEVEDLYMEANETETREETKRRLIEWYKNYKSGYDNLDHFISEHTCPRCHEVGWGFSIPDECFTCDVCGYREDVLGQPIEAQSSNADERTDE